MSNDGRMEDKTVGEMKQNFPKRPVSMFEPRENNNYNKISASGDNRAVTSMYHMTRLNQSDSTIFPTSDEVICRTDAITRRIQDLVGAMQDLTKKNAFVPCAERIHAAVTDLVVIFPTVSLVLNPYICQSRKCRSLCSPTFQKLFIILKLKGGLHRSDLQHLIC